MVTLLDDASRTAKRFPDLVLAGHVHNYQRFTRTVSGRSTPYIVAGGGGYWHLHAMARAPGGGPLTVPWPIPGGDATLEAYAADRHGYLRLTVTAHEISGAYTTVPRPQESWSNGPVQVVDTFTVDLTARPKAAASRRGASRRRSRRSG